MSQTTTSERLILIEEKMEQNTKEHCSILIQLEKLEAKLDSAISQKVDKKQYEVFVNRLWGIGISIVIAVFVSYLGLIAWVTQNWSK